MFNLADTEQVIVELHKSVGRCLRLSQSLQPGFAQPGGRVISSTRRDLLLLEEMEGFSSFFNRILIEKP